MDGYLNNTNRVLNEWYNLFKQKRSIFSKKELKHWEYIKKFEILNFKNDYCKYISIEDFLQHHFVCSKHCKHNQLKYKKLELPIDCHKLIFIDGKFFPSLSDSIIDPWILNINTNFENYKTLTPINPNIFLYLTESLSDAIIHITLPEKVIPKKPLYLLHIQSGSTIQDQLVTSHYYHYIDIKKNTNACIIEHFISLNEDKHFTGTRMILSIDEQAIFQHVKLVCENQNSYHISHQDINIKKNSEIDSNSFIIEGPKFIHHKVNSKINDLQSSLSINSLSVLSKKSVCDIQTYLEHNNQGYAVSKQLHKIIANNNSTGIFKGLIKVNKKSVNTDAKMINNNLLLHQSASIYSIPKLEIYSDAVQCGHGSTIGQIDVNDLFYLNTRGITQKDALKILICAFTEEVTQKIKHSLLKNFIMEKINYAVIRGK